MLVGRGQVGGGGGAAPEGRESQHRLRAFLPVPLPPLLSLLAPEVGAMREHGWRLGTAAVRGRELCRLELAHPPRSSG